MRVILGILVLSAALTIPAYALADHGGPCAILKHLVRRDCEICVPSLDVSAILQNPDKPVRDCIDIPLPPLP